MSVETAPTPPSPGVGARRKGPKILPTLPPSAFSPPNTGTSDKFPLPPSPSTIHPDAIVDAHVAVSPAALAEWKAAAGAHLGGQSGGVVLALQAQDVQAALSAPPSDPPVISYIVPYSAETASLDSSRPIAYGYTFTANTPDAVDTLKTILATGRTVDVAVASPDDWDALEDFLTKATEVESTGRIVLSNILPPPHDLALPIVKLLSHPTYIAYQSRIASLSLFPHTYIKFLPPAWNAPTPAADSKENKEWKRRIKMYLGPALEAFGFERILFGSGGQAATAGDWYEMARESFAELGVEQEAINAVFGGNVNEVYGSA